MFEDRGRVPDMLMRPEMEMAAAALRVSRAIADEDAFRGFLSNQPSELAMALAQLDVARALLAEARDAIVPPRCHACGAPAVGGNAVGEAEAEAEP